MLWQQMLPAVWLALHEVTAVFFLFNAAYPAAAAAAVPAVQAAVPAV
jgi:hypothetical protein